MDALTRLLSCLFVLALLAAGCTGSDDPDDADPGDDPTEEDGAAADPSDAADAEGATGGFQIPVLEGAEIDVDQAILDAATTWILEESGLSEMLQEELVLAAADMTRDVHHLTYEQQHGGVSVRGAQLVVHIRDTGEVLASSQSLSTTLPGEGTTEELSEAEAIDIATKAVPAPVTADPVVTAIWLESGSELRLGWEVRLVTDEPAEYAVVVDATDGQVLSVDQASSSAGHVTPPDDGVEVAQASACDAPPAPSACIFVVDPLFSSGQPTVNPAEADQLLVGVPLDNLIDPTDGQLVGEYAQIIELERPLYAEPDNIYGEGGRGGDDPGFAAGMAYYWIDYTQQLMQSIGYDYHADDPVDLLPIDPSNTDNAAYLPLLDLISIGVTSNGQIALAEDAQVIIHEYGHAIVESVVPDSFGPEGGAFNEAFADVLMVLATLEFRNGDIGCLSAYFGQQLGLPAGGCIRRIDTDKVYPDDLVQEVHLDGEIYTGAVWDLFEAVLLRETGLTPDECQDPEANPCDAVRDDVLGTALGSLPFLTPQLTLADAAAAFHASDAVFYGSTNEAEITDAFTSHGLEVEGSPMVQMSSGPMELGDLERTASQVTLKITHENRGDLGVQMIGFDAATDEPICVVTFAQPSSNEVGEDLVGRYDLAGSTCEEFLPPSPERVFELTVADLTEGASGELLQFTIIHEGQTFRAEGLPQAIPDATGLPAIAAIPSTDTGGALPMMDPAEPDGGTPPGGTPPGGTPPGGAPAGTIEADISITHTYIGDLDVILAVFDAETSEAVCAVEIIRSDPSDSSDDFSGTVDLSSCAGFYPPSAQAIWTLIAVDNAQADVGSVDSFVIRGPDGGQFPLAGPVPIPDADPEGVVTVITP